MFRLHRGCPGTSASTIGRALLLAKPIADRGLVGGPHAAGEIRLARLDSLGQARGGGFRGDLVMAVGHHRRTAVLDIGGGILAYG